VIITQILPIVQPHLPAATTSGDKAAMLSAHGDRLLQLAAKGLFYESCVDYCQAKAVRETGASWHEHTHPHTGTDGADVACIPGLLDCRLPLNATDLSLLSWLESIGIEQFSLPFEQRQLDYRVRVGCSYIHMHSCT
jgi:hypothetical protein